MKDGQVGFWRRVAPMAMVRHSDFSGFTLDLRCGVPAGDWAGSEGAVKARRKGKGRLLRPWSWWWTWRDQEAEAGKEVPREWEQLNLSPPLGMRKSKGDAHEK